MVQPIKQFKGITQPLKRGVCMEKRMALTEDQCRKLEADDILTLIIEEASEVIHAASKIKRFGPHGSHPDMERYNYLNLLIEGQQLERLLRHYSAKHDECLNNMEHRQNYLTAQQFRKMYPYTKPVEHQMSQWPIEEK